jgi:amino acid efflux transporter
MTTTTVCGNPTGADAGTVPQRAAVAGMSVLQGAALTTGAVLGTGVISLPAMAAGIAGPASLVAWLALVLLSMPLAATFAALGSRFPDAGGVSTYARRAFGPRLAAMVGWCFYFAIPVGATPAAAFAGGYVADTFGGGRATQVWTAGALMLIVGAMNAFGVRVSGRVQLGFAGVLAALLTLATVAALPHARFDNLTPFAPHGWMAVGSAAAVLVWAFAGWEAVTSLTSEYRTPRRDIPRATTIAVVVVGVLYLGVATASIAVLGPAAGSSNAPLADLLVIGLGEPARPVTTLVAVLLTVGAMNAYFAGAAKLGAALGRDQALPAWFAQGSPSGEAPRRSLSVVVVLSLAGLALNSVLGSDLEVSVLLTTGSFTLVYVIGTAAAVRLLPRPSWSWFGAVLSFASVLVLLWMIGFHAVWGLGVAGAALSYSFAAARRTSAESLARPSPIEPGTTAP